MADLDNDSMISYGEFQAVAKGRGRRESKNPVYQENFILKERYENEKFLLNKPPFLP